MTFPEQKRKTQEKNHVEEARTIGSLSDKAAGEKQLSMQRLPLPLPLVTVLPTSLSFKTHFYTSTFLKGKSDHVYPNMKMLVVFCCLQVVGTRLLVRCQGMPCPLLPRASSGSLFYGMYYFLTWIPPAPIPCEQEQMPSSSFKTYVANHALQCLFCFPSLLLSLAFTLSHSLSISFLSPVLPFFLFVLTKQISCSLRMLLSDSMLHFNFTAWQLHVCVCLHVLAWCILAPCPCTLSGL